MYIRVLGPLEVIGPDGPASLRSHRLRRLLGALVARRGNPVSTDRLVDAVWGPEPPPGAPSTLHGYVHRLRSIVGEAVATTPAGYRLDGVEVDADRFSALLREAEGAARGADHEGALRAYDAALGLWYGDAYGELAEYEFARLEAVELEERRRTAVEDRADALLATGRHASAIPELRSAMEQEPYRDRRCAQLMLALYRDGRQADALDAYAGHRRRLIDDLGLDPSSELGSLERLILEQSALLLAPGSADRGAPAEVPAGAVVEAVACAFLPPDGEVIAAVTGLEPLEVLAQLEECVRAGVLTADATGRYRLVDGDTADRVGSRIPAPRRAQLHAAYLDHPSLQGADTASAVARAAHAAAAVPLVRVADAAACAQEAGRMLLGHGRLAEAATWFARAADILPATAPERIDALVDRATALAWAGDPAWLQVTLEAGALADESDHVGALASAALVNPVGIRTGIPARVDLLRRALARVTDDDPLVPVLLGELALELDHPGEEHERGVAWEAADAASQRVSVAETTARVLVAKLNDAGIFLLPHRRQALAADLEALGHDLGNADALWLAAAHQYWATIQTADRAGADRALAKAESRRAGHTHVGAHRFTDHLRGIDAALHGDLERAERLALLAFDDQAPDQLGLGLSRANTDGLLLRIRRDQGRLAELLPYYEGPLALFPCVFGSVTRALIRADLGDLGAAGRELDDRALDERCPALYRPHLSMLIAEAAEACGRPEHAEQAVDVLRPLAGIVMCTTRGCDGAVDRALALALATCGRLDAADRWLTSALHLHEKLRAPALVARTLHDRARLLDDHVAARRCAQLADRHGLAGLHGIISVTGAPRSRSPRRGPATPPSPASA